MCSVERLRNRTARRSTRALCSRPALTLLAVLQHLRKEQLADIILLMLDGSQRSDTAQLSHHTRSQPRLLCCPHQCNHHQTEEGASFAADITLHALDSQRSDTAQLSPHARALRHDRRQLQQQRRARWPRAGANFVCAATLAYACSLQLLAIRAQHLQYYCFHSS